MSAFSDEDLTRIRLQLERCTCNAECSSMWQPTLSAASSPDTELLTSAFLDQVWYGVPANASDALEDAMKDALPDLFEAAPDLMYSLVTMVSPTNLQVWHFVFHADGMQPCHHASGSVCPV